MLRGARRMRGVQGMRGQTDGIIGGGMGMADEGRKQGVKSGPWERQTKKTHAPLFTFQGPTSTRAILTPRAHLPLALPGPSGHPMHHLQGLYFTLCITYRASGKFRDAATYAGVAPCSSRASMSAPNSWSTCFRRFFKRWREHRGKTVCTTGGIKTSKKG